MKRLMSFILVVALALFFGFQAQNILAQQKGKTSEKGFVDADGDGINDNAKDDDGDGIPNGKDSDYKSSKNCNKKTMGKQGKGKNKMNCCKNKVKAKGFVDTNGDGLNDNAKDADGDGIPNGQDPDFDGQKSRKGKAGKGFTDKDGDGINDNALDADGDGIPNCKDEDYVKTEDGSGSENGRRGKNCNRSGGCQKTNPEGGRGGSN